MRLSAVTASSSRRISSCAVVGVSVSDNAVPAFVGSICQGTSYGVRGGSVADGRLRAVGEQRDGGHHELVEAVAVDLFLEVVDDRGENEPAAVAALQQPDVALDSG